VSMAVAVLAIVALCAPFADAQGGGGQRGQRGPGGRGGGFGPTYVSIATNADVQALIKATEEQKTKLAAVNTKLNEDRQALRGGGGDPATMATDIAKMNADASTKAAEALDSAQNTNVL